MIIATYRWIDIEKDRRSQECENKITFVFTVIFTFMNGDLVVVKKLGYFQKLWAMSPEVSIKALAEQS